MKTGFDNEKYLRIQSEQIKKRISQFGDKLYLEFGGKLFDDNHASRVLPGFQPDSKLQMLLQLKDEAEIVMVISALDIEKNKVRGDLGITYDEDVLRLRSEFEKVEMIKNPVIMVKIAKNDVTANATILNIKGYNDIKIGDVVEAYTIEEIKRTL